MKVLLLGPDQSKRYNWGHQLFKDEVARQHDVRFYGDGYPDWMLGRFDVREIMRVLDFDPDVILTYMAKYVRWVQGMDEIKIPKVHIEIDYFPWNYGVLDEFVERARPDLLLAVCSHEVRAIEKRLAVRVEHLPFSVDTDVFRNNGQAKEYDVMAVYSVVSWAYPTRSRIMDTLQGLGVRSFLQASWPKTRIWHQDYVDILARSKMVVNGVDTHQSLNWKFMEPCAVGSMLLTERAEDMTKLGFVHNVNCVVFEGVDDLVRKVKRYLEDNEERRRISSAGSFLVRGSHSTRQRVEDMTFMLKREFGL